MNSGSNASSFALASSMCPQTVTTALLPSMSSFLMSIFPNIERVGSKSN